MDQTNFKAPIKNLYQHIKSLAQSKKETTALIKINKEGDTTTELTYQQLLNYIEKTANFLLTHHQPGQRIALYFTNSIELLVLSWAAWSVGIVTVPLDTKRDTEEVMTYKSQLTEAKSIFHHPDTTLPISLQYLSTPFTLEKIQNQTSEITPKPDLSHEALILFTSGTTGRPKGASLSLKNLIANGDGIKDWFQITDQDRFMVILPLHHINSTSFCFSALLAQASIAIPDAYSATKFWQQLAKSKATFTSIVPTICYDQLSFESAYQQHKSSLKVKKIQIGSAPVKPSEVKEFIQKYQINLYQGYGQTETALRVAGQPHNLSPELYQQLITENSIGIEMKWATLAILDPDGEQRQEGQEGQLAVKGPVVMKGYLGGEKAFDQNGWFLTGDLAYYKIINGQKFFYLKGRIKEIIIKGGVNVSPAAVEDLLKQLEPNIDLVYTIGVPDQRYGEEIAAVISWKNPQQQIQNEYQLKQKLNQKSPIISDFEKPKYLYTIDKTQFPKTSTGKIQRSVIKKNTSIQNLSPINEITRNQNHSFQLLHKQNREQFSQTLALYNKCWSPLTIDAAQLTQITKNGLIITSTDHQNHVTGFIIVQRTNLSQQQLSTTNYSELSADLTLQNFDQKGENLICLAVGSHNYQPSKEKLPPIKVTTSQLQTYLQEGHDHVYNFHTKAKAGLKTGAELITIIPNSRPEDLKAAGFNILLKYPIPPQQIITPDHQRSIGTQLIEAVITYAQLENIKNIYAFSRPSNLHQHFSK